MLLNETLSYNCYKANKVSIVPIFNRKAIENVAN